ncbi:unnamed protein product [Brachionus calyciflorus]|uniref:Uncharacterized protein n=1 Tax=Brachionus calyciflorus TaxID=104777 RepID=A0A814A006_9BILA|nr:unnamed protein product [Brachionus calyciflorus]
MLKTRSEIIEYYSDFKNQIDIECEKKTIQLSLSDNDKKTIEMMRNDFLDLIKLHENLHLEKFETGKCNQYDTNVIDRFCFFIPFLNDDKTSRLRFGTLVLTNQFLTKNTINLVKFFVGLEPKDDFHYKSKDIITACVLSQLILDKQENPLIYLRDQNTNILESLELNEFNLYELDENDFEIIDTLINRRYLKKCFFDLKLNRFENNVFSKLNMIKDLVIEVLKDCEFEPLCFNNLNNLNNLDLSYFNSKKIDSSILFGMHNLKSLRICEARANELGAKCFKYCPNLENIYLAYFRIGNIYANTFDKLENLKCLNMMANEIPYVPKEIFTFMKNLTYLSLSDVFSVPFDATYLNNLENLEILYLFASDTILNLDELNLPKLKHLSISSKKIPNFKLNLKSLHISDLEQLETDSFDQLTSLKGLFLLNKEKLIEKIKHENFSKLAQLKFLNVVFTKTNQIDANYLKEFLCEPCLKYDVLKRNTFYSVSVSQKIKKLSLNIITPFSQLKEMRP